MEGGGRISRQRGVSAAPGNRLTVDVSSLGIPVSGPCGRPPLQPDSGPRLWAGVMGCRSHSTLGGDNHPKRPRSLSVSRCRQPPLFPHPLAPGMKRDGHGDDDDETRYTAILSLT